MNAFKNTLIGLLAAAVAALGALAWSQSRELAALRAQAAANDSVSLRKQLADARRASRLLEDRMAAFRSRGTPAAAPAVDPGADFSGGSDGPRRGGMAAFAAMNGNPEFDRLVAIQIKARLSQVFGPLFKTLNLGPAQLAQFQSLLVDKQQAIVDVMQAAREQGINPRADPEGFRTLMNQSVAQSDEAIRNALGDSGFQQYQQFQQTLPERNVVNSLQQSLSYTQTPLTDDAANQMITLLSQTQPQRPGNGTAGTANGGNPGPGIFSLMNGGGTARVTAETLTQAQGVLSAPQILALQQIQQQQEAQQQIQQLIRSGNAGGPKSGPPAPAPGPGKG